MTKEKDLKYIGPNYWVLQVKNGFEVYKTGITHSTRCAQIGYQGCKGLNKAINECIRRERSLEKQREDKINATFCDSQGCY